MLTAIRVAGQLLAAIFDPAHGMTELAAQPGRADFLGQQDALVAEAAAHIRRDHADPRLRQIRGNPPGQCGRCAAFGSRYGPRNCSARRSQVATTPRPSIGDMHCRAVRNLRRTTIGAGVANRSAATSTNVSRKTLLSQCSWTLVSLVSAARMSTIAGSSSNSTSTDAARSSAAARLAATQTAIGSPTWRTLVVGEHRLRGRFETRQSGYRDDRPHARQDRRR